MSVHRKPDGCGWTVRWREGARNRQRTFDRRRDAQDFDAEVRRRRRLGGLLTELDGGRVTLDRYVVEHWAPVYGADLAPKTRALYSWLYQAHIGPDLGALSLREISPEVIARWQAQRLRATGKARRPAGREAIRKAHTLLGAILQRAVEERRIADNPCRLIRKPRASARAEVRPLAPEQIERLRECCGPRDATFAAVLAYAGLRPGEALALRWSDIGQRTLLVQRAVSLGEIRDTKTGAHRSVRLLEPPRRDLAEWRLACGRPDDGALVFPGRDGRPWTQAAYQSWRRRTFAAAVKAAGLPHCRPYDLGHSYASLLLHEGRSVIDVARQLGHGAALTLGVYGHVIDELDSQPRLAAEDAIRAARQPPAAERA